MRIEYVHLANNNRICKEVIAAAKAHLNGIF